MATSGEKPHDESQPEPEGLATPFTIKHQGNEWEFVRVGVYDGKTSVYLRPAESQDRFVTRADLANGRVVLQQAESGQERQLDLGNEADLAVLERLMTPGESVRSNERLFFEYAGGYIGQDAQLSGANAQPQRLKIAVSKDPALVRLKVPGAHVIAVPLGDLESVPVRVKGREGDGVAFLSLDSDDQLVVSGPGIRGKLQVSPDDLVGEHNYHWSYTLGQVPVEVMREAVMGAATGALPPPGAQHASPLDALSEYRISPIASQDIKSVQAGPGDELIRKMTQFVKTLSPGTPLVIRQWRFDDTKDPVMHELVRAICQHASQGAEVDLLLSQGKLSSRMKQMLDSGGVTVQIVSDPPHRMVVHQKSIATPDRSIIYTGPFDPKAGKRMEVMVELQTDLSRLYFQYESLSAKPDRQVGPQQDYLARLAARGLVVDRPDVTTAYAGRSYWALARGAQTSIELYVKELADPEFTRLLLSKAASGVDVKIRLSEPDNHPVDKASERLIETARENNPDLAFSIDMPREAPYRHYNVIVADNKVGAVGTLYPWPNGLGQLDPAGGGTEHALVFAGEGLGLVQEALRKARTQTQGQAQALKTAQSVVRNVRKPGGPRIGL